MARPYWFSGDFKPVNLASWMIRNVPLRPLREAVQNLHGATQTFKDEREKLAPVIASAYEQDRQLKWVLWTGGIALLVGLLISPIFARGSLFGWEGGVEANSGEVGPAGTMVSYPERRPAVLPERAPTSAATPTQSGLNTHLRLCRTASSGVTFDPTAGFRFKRIACILWRSAWRSALCLMPDVLPSVG